MRQSEVEKAAELLGTMRELELALESFYAACAAAFPAESIFWQGIAAQERHHAERIERMIDFVAENPGRYTWGRKFQIAAVTAMLSDLRASRERVQRGAMDFKAALLAGRNYESSLLEARYNEVLVTTDPDYVALAAEIIAQTRAHQASIAGRVAALVQPR